MTVALAAATQTEPAPIGIEQLVHWALAPGRDGGLPWREEATLGFDLGLTARPRKRPPGDWAIAEACAGLMPTTRRLRITATPDPDAEAVKKAISQLPPAMASLVLAHGRRGTRPDWRETKIRFVPAYGGREGPDAIRIAYANRRNGQRSQPYCVLREKAYQTSTRESRARYELWHEGLLCLCALLADTPLRRWQINGLIGFTAPFSPWLDEPRLTAAEIV